MSWSVEYTDEFGGRFATLIDVVQDDIARVVGVLEARGRSCPSPTRPESKAPDMSTCVNCGFRAAENPTGYFMPSPPVILRFC
jgi:hypothetical protein